MDGLMTMPQIGYQQESIKDPNAMYDSLFGNTIRPQQGVPYGMALPEEEEGWLEKILSMGSSEYGKEHGMAGMQAPQAQATPLGSLMAMVGQNQPRQNVGVGYANPYVKSLMGGQYECFRYLYSFKTYAA